MLTRKTYTPDLEAKAAPILPGATASIREQVAREQARLRVEAVGPQGDGVGGFRAGKSAQGARRPAFKREKLRECSFVAVQRPTAVSVANSPTELTAKEGKA